MVADVGYMVCKLDESRSTRRYHEGRLPTDMITRNLLRESFSDDTCYDSRELDVHLHVPSDWPENCLDLIESGKFYLQKCSSSKSNRPAARQIKRPLETYDLDLKCQSNDNSSTYQSVCTLEKVKSALDREKLHDQLVRRNLTSSISPTSSSGVTSGASMASSSQQEGDLKLKLSVAGCSNCLMYVMISNENAKCPKCDSMVSLPVVNKKPRINLDLKLYL